MNDNLLLIELNEEIVELKKEIERLNKMLDEKFMKENTFLVENGIICKKNKEIERLTKVEKEHQKINGELREENNRLNNIINELEHDFESYELEYLQDTYQGSLADFIETELERIQELKGEDNNEQ